MPRPSVQALIGTLTDAQCSRALEALIAILKERFGISYNAMSRTLGYEGKNGKQDLTRVIEGKSKVVGVSAREGLAMLLNEYVSDPGAVRFLINNGATSEDSDSDTPSDDSDAADSTTASESEDPDAPASAIPKKKSDAAAAAKKESAVPAAAAAEEPDAAASAKKKSDAAASAKKESAVPAAAAAEEPDAAASATSDQMVYVAERVPLAQLVPSPAVERLRQGSTVVGLLCPDDGAPGHDPMTCDYVHRRRE